MEHQSVFSGENKKNTIKLSSAELTKIIDYRLCLCTPHKCLVNSKKKKKKKKKKMFIYCTSMIWPGPSACSLQIAKLLRMICACPDQIELLR